MVAKISLEYKFPVKYLNILYADSTRYVTRSVANHLNDIAKKNPNIVTKILARWKREGLQTKKELDWISKHALRTLIKKGHAGALSLIGFSDTTSIAVEQFWFSNEKIKIIPGEALEFSCTLSASADAAVLVDYVIDFKKANGTFKSKVYKWKQLQIKAGQANIISKRHILKADATTFKLYPGEHKITVQINGKQSSSIAFTLH